MYSEQDARVTVLIPVRDGAATVAASVTSVLSDHDVVDECIVIDDGSTDDLAGALSVHAHDPRLRVIPNRGVGLPSALNTGLDAARNALIARLDADDESVAGRFAEQSRYLIEHPGTALVGGQIVRVNSAGSVMSTSKLPISHSEIMRSLERGLHGVAHSSIMFRKSPVRYAERPAEDYAFFFDQAATGLLENLSKPVIRYRYHSSSITSTSMLPHRRDLIHLLHERGRARGPEWARSLRARREARALTLYKKTVSEQDLGNARRALYLIAAGGLFPSIAIERLRRELAH